MEITRTARAEYFELKLKGRIDATWSDHVAHALAESVRAGQHTIAVDMAEVDYISSAGLRVLVLYARQLNAIQGHLAVSNASSMVRKVLELSGLESLLLAAAGPGAAAAPGTEPFATQLALPEPGATAEVFDLDPKATLRVQRPGDATAWFAGQIAPDTCPSVQFPADLIGLGLGAMVSGDSANSQPFGEFLAAAGAAVVQPADGSNKPDYLLQQGALRPELRVAYGMLGRGGFRRLLHFDKGPQQPSLPLSTLIRAALEAIGSEAAGMVLVAETASLIGASLRKQPGQSPPAAGEHDIFGFPGVRDWLSLTAEAAFANSTCLIVGFAARGPAAGGQQAGEPAAGTSGRLRLLRPVVRSGEVYGHFHAAALPYCPLRKGRLDLAETIQRLFECEQVLGLLHLLNDWRELSGAGESRLLRGACWCAPLTF